MAGSHAEAALKLEFHHINYVSKDVDALHKFYVDILKMDDIAPQNFPRTDATDKTGCLLYTSPSPRDRTRSRMPSSA